MTTSIPNSLSETTFALLPLTQLEESPTNPRRRYNQLALEDLARSIETQGVVEPLLVRPLNHSRYEIVAGARRFRAARIAKLAEVPALIRTMSDADAQLLQIVENLQREDVHPFEEAVAYRNLIDAGMSIDEVAAKVGKKSAFVALRLVLTKLNETIATAFLDDRIPLAHAITIAKLQPSQQDEAFAACFRQVWNTGGYRVVVITLKELEVWIEQNVLLELASAPFDQSDAMLVPDAGACIDCRKRTGFDRLLFGDIQQDSCLEKACFHAKLDAHVRRTVECKPNLVQITTAWGKKGDRALLTRDQYMEIEKPPRGRRKSDNPSYRRCSHTIEALVADGPGRVFSNAFVPSHRARFTTRHCGQQKQNNASSATICAMKQSAERRISPIAGNCLMRFLRS